MRMAAKVWSTSSAARHALITGPPGVGKTTLVRSVCQVLEEKHHVELHGFYTEEVRVGVAAGRRGQRVGFDVVCFDGERGPLARVEGEGRVRADRTSASQPGRGGGGSRRLIFVGKYRVDLESFESIALPRLRTHTAFHTQSSSSLLEGHSVKELRQSKVAQDQFQELKIVHKLSTHDKIATSSLAQQPEQMDTVLQSDKTSNPQKSEAVHTLSLQSAATSAEKAAPTKRRLFVIDEIGKMELFSREFVRLVQGLFQRAASNEDVVVMATIPIARHKSHWLVEELRGRKDCRLFEVTEKNRNEFVDTVSKFILQCLS